MFPIVFFNECDNEYVLKKYVETNAKKYLISVANYSAVKNQKMILEAFYKANTGSYALVLIGSTKNYYYDEVVKYKKYLERKFAEKEIYLLTQVKRNDIPSFIKNASIYLVASTFEEYSISIIETMSQAIPFISTNVGNAKLLPGGIIINSIEEMIGSINSLLRDDKYRNELGQMGKEYAYNNCTVTKALNNLETIIKSS